MAHLAKALSTFVSKAAFPLKNILCVFSRLVIRHTCSIGFKSGEYGGNFTKTTFSLISAYSGFFSSTINRIAFLCHGALSTMMANFFPASMGGSDVFPHTVDGGFKSKPFRLVYKKLPCVRTDKAAIRYLVVPRERFNLRGASLLVPCRGDCRLRLKMNFVLVRGD